MTGQPDRLLVFVGSVLATSVSVATTWFFAKHQVRREARIQHWLDICPKLTPRKTGHFDGQGARLVIADLLLNAFLAGVEDQLAG